MNGWARVGTTWPCCSAKSSRKAYVQQAREREETYTFVDAEGRHRTWLKSEHAYLAVNAASVFLSRCNLKHDVVNEDQLTEATLATLSALVIPNAGHLEAATIARIEQWMRDPAHSLLVTGRTNLPPALLGLRSAQLVKVTGYTGWRWLEGSPFAGPSWEPLYVAGYRGHAVQLVQPAPGSRVLADLLEYSGDLSNASTVTATRMGPAIVTTARTVYIANQIFELIGGMLQAHLNVEAVRHWANPTHWGDSLLFFIRQLVLDTGWAPLWQTRLRSFGTYQGVLSFRHDVHGMRDYTMLDYQVQNLIPGSYDIEDPGFSTNITEPMARDWVERATRNSFIEPALHNDSSIGDPPTGNPRQGPVHARDQRREEPGLHGLHLRPARRRPHASGDHRRDGLPVPQPRQRAGHVHLLLLPHDRVRGARPQRGGRGHDAGRQGADLYHRPAAHDRHAGHLVPVPRRGHHRPGVAAAARLGPHPRVRRRLRSGRRHLRRPPFAQPGSGRPAGERRLQLPVPPRAGARSFGQRRPGHARLPALLHQPGRAQRFLDRHAKGAVPAHGRLPGPGVPGALRRP